MRILSLFDGISCARVALLKQNFKIERYSVSAFFCQQAVEKMLKAGFMKKKNTIIPPATHSLIFLAKELGISGRFADILRKLSPHYTLSRYPGITEELPSELYTQNSAKEIIKQSEQVIKWLRKQM